jgi:HK97 family phage prohead protease
MDFILNDESKVNSHGFVLLNAGGDFDRFLKNPVMLHRHDDAELIGTWDRLRTEGSMLKAEPRFDTEDDFAKKIEGRVARGFLKGASVGIIILDAELRSMPDGDVIPFVTRWELLEASVVSVPSNAGALKLYNQNGEIIENEQIQLSINSILISKQKLNKMDKKENSLSAQAYMALGLNSDADAAALSAAVVALQARAEKAEKELDDRKTAAADALVTKAIADGRLSADKKDDFVRLATADFAQAQNIIDAIPARQTVGDRVKPGSKSEQAATGRDDWDYKRWAKEDPKGLKQMSVENPDAFGQLRAKYKG